MKKTGGKKIGNLFPHYNPNPVLELNETGDITYSNPAAYAAIKDAGKAASPAMFLPLKLKRDITQKHRRLEAQNYEFSIGDKFFYESASYIPELKTWRVYATDITVQKNNEKEAARLTRTYRLLSNINKAIVRANDRQEILQETCKIAVKTGQYPLVWIGLVDKDSKEIKPIARCGPKSMYLDSIKISLDPKVPEGKGPTAETIQSGKFTVCNDWDTTKLMWPWRATGLKHNFHSSAAFPLIINEKVIGAINYYSSEKNTFNLEEVSLLNELAADISFCLANFERRPEKDLLSLHLTNINDAFLKFGADPLANINILISLVGKLLNPDFVAYSRIDGDNIRTLGTWNAPADYCNIKKISGKICLDMVRTGKDDPVVIRDLQNTKYVKTDPNVKKCRLQTYMGKAIKTGRNNIGILYMAYHQDYEPTGSDLRVVNIAAAAIGTEEARREADKTVHDNEVKFRGLFEFTHSCVAIYRAIDDGRDFVITDFNRAAEQADKIKRADIVGKSVREVFPGVVKFGLYDVFKKVWRSGEPEHFPLAMYADKRISGWRENDVFKLPSGEVAAVYQDLTEIKKVEEKMKLSDEELKKKINELEKFKKVTVGRELRMIEMKKELQRAKPTDLF